MFRCKILTQNTPELLQTSSCLQDIFLFLHTFYYKIKIQFIHNIKLAVPNAGWKTICVAIQHTIA